MSIDHQFQKTDLLSEDIWMEIYIHRTSVISLIEKTQNNTVRMEANN